MVVVAGGGESVLSGRYHRARKHGTSVPPSVVVMTYPDNGHTELESAPDRGRGAGGGGAGGTCPLFWTG